MGWSGRAICRRAARDRRHGLARTTDADGALHAYLAEPFPDASVPHTELPLLAVDVETTGLDPARDRVVSVGMVPVDGTRIRLDGARRVLVRGPDVGPSAAIHHVTDDDLADGVPLADAVDAVLDALRGRVLLAHHVALERRFLTAACREVHGVGLPGLSVCTLQLARRLTTSPWDDEPAPGSLRLDAVRARHGLPRYRAHEALTDALAAAELYLAQVGELGAGRPVPLHRLVTAVR